MDPESQSDSGSIWFNAAMYLDGRPWWSDEDESFSGDRPCAFDALFLPWVCAQTPAPSIPIYRLWMLPKPDPTYRELPWCERQSAYAASWCRHRPVWIQWRRSNWQKLPISWNRHVSKYVRECLRAIAPKHHHRLLHYELDWFSSSTFSFYYFDFDYTYFY